MKLVHLERLAAFGTANMSNRDDQTKVEGSVANTSTRTNHN